MNTRLSVLALSMAIVVSPAWAYDLNENLSINLTLAATGQCQSLTNGDAPDSCRGGLPLQLEGLYRPAKEHELGLKLGFAAGNGLNTISPFVLLPWAAALEDDVKHINGRHRNYLLSAWYRYEAQLTADQKLAGTLGILDSTVYLDTNEYANDEYTQFMNEVFVNSGIYGLPSYDGGAAAQWELGDWSLAAVGMNVGENDDGNSYNFYGAQLAYKQESGFGPGHYRLILSGTNDRFLDPSGINKNKRFAGGLSFDQAFGDVIGGFLRFSWQNEDPLVDYKSLYSGGLNFKGSGWGREADNIGIGYAYLPGGNSNIDHTQAFETYYRFGVSDQVSLTFDLQWMQDRYRNQVDVQDPEGWIFGLRFTAMF